MTILQIDVSVSDAPKYLAIADAISEAIDSGKLAAGEKLPPQRNLAYDVGVTLGTVTRAYQEIKRRGLVGGEVGRGTYVLDPATATHPIFEKGPFHQPQTEGSSSDVLDFMIAAPVSGMAGKMLSQTLAEISQEPDLNILTHYYPNRDIPHHLDAGVKWISQTGIQTTADQIGITNGSQHGICMALSAIARPGDTILTEELTYPGFIQIARHFGYNLHPVAMDEDGLLPDALEAACKQSKARSLYCIPTLHNPLITTMPNKRRAEIVAVARKYDLSIIEDDIWGLLDEERQTPLMMLAPERTIYVTGLSKAMAGGLRIGYIHGPKHIMPAIHASIRANSWMTAPLMSEIAARWIFDGTGDALNKWQRQQSEKRVNIAQELLQGYKMKFNPGACNIWLELPPTWRASELLQEARQHGLAFKTAETFTVGMAPAPHAIRLCLGSSNTEDDVITGLTRIKALLDQGPTASHAVF